MFFDLSLAFDYDDNFFKATNKILLYHVMFAKFSLVWHKATSVGHSANQQY